MSVVIPDDPSLQIYNSYDVDPTYANTFTYAWVGVAAGIVALGLPRFLAAARSGRLFAGALGVREDWTRRTEKPASAITRPRTTRSVLDGPRGLLSAISSVLRWTLPLIELDIGQLLVIFAYLATLLYCIVHDSPLLTSPNRAGFLALAQLPVVFLLGTKSSVLSFLLGPGAGYEKLNWIHKAAGRGIFLAAVIHGSLWINNRLVNDQPILGMFKESTGIAAFGTLCVLVLSSLRPVRQFAYQAFFALHVVTYTAFFILVCVHTPYAAPWIYPPVALYAADLVIRLLRFRVKDATLRAADHQMTLVDVHDAGRGWAAGQHVRLRVFAGARVLESHPLTALAAPPARSVLAAAGVVGRDTLQLGVRAAGDWSRSLNALARAGVPAPLDPDCAPLLETDGVPVTVMIDGPYGGCSLDLGEYENVLLLAGGSGATFALGMLDDILGRILAGRLQGERTRRIELAWYIRSYGAILWFAPHLAALARAAARPEAQVDLHISVFVTCLCDPEAVPDIPNSLVTMERPEARAMLEQFIRPASGTRAGGSVESAQSVEVGAEKPAAGGAGKEREELALPRVNAGVVSGAVRGGVAVCVAGPESLARSAANAVARVAARDGARVGGIALHSEVYAL